MELSARTPTSWLPKKAPLYRSCQTMLSSLAQRAEGLDREARSMAFEYASDAAMSAGKSPSCVRSCSRGIGSPRGSVEHQGAERLVNSFCPAQVRDGPI